MTYTVTANDVENFITPEPCTYIAQQVSREVSVVYEYITFGVFIQGISGKLYNPDKWTSQETPNGVAVIALNCSFAIALEDAYNSLCHWGGSENTVSGIITTNSKSTAVTDYSGESNTTTIISALNGYNDNYVTGAPAAEYCRAYTFPNGKKGYLGAAGEWQTVLDNKAAITSALSKCGGTAMKTYYWTSTQYDSDDSWWIYWTDSTLTNSRKHTTNYVRAFCSI